MPSGTRPGGPLRQEVPLGQPGETCEEIAASDVELHISTPVR